MSQVKDFERDYPADQLRDTSIKFTAQECRDIYEGLCAGHRFAAGVYIRATKEVRNQQRDKLQKALVLMENQK